MYAGTGSTRGWRGWIKSGRHRHSLGMKDWQEQQAASGWALGVEPNSASASTRSSLSLGSLDSPGPSPVDDSDEL
jgi:hypothetical protein